MAFTDEWAAIGYRAMDVPKLKRLKVPTKAASPTEVSNYVG